MALTSFCYFAASLAIIGAAAFALDRWVIPELENRGYLESHLWSNENHRLNHFTYLKNDARKEDPVWRSQYIPVSAAHPGKNAKRILVIGDSFVWGDGSNNVNTLWWRQLDLELKRRGYGNVEVIAAGLNGASTHDQLNWLSTILPKYSPDLVIFGCVTNDPDEKDNNGKPYHKLMPKELPAEKKADSKLSRLLPNLAGQLDQINKLSRQAHLSQKSTALEYADWELALLKGPNFQAYKKTVSTVSETLKAAGVPAFVISLPAGFQNKTKENTASGQNYFESVRSYNAERFSALAPVFKSSGLLFVDTTESFAKAAAADPLLKASGSSLRLGINPGNGHPGPFSTHFYAVTAADTIERNFSPSAPSGISQGIANSERYINNPWRWNIGESDTIDGDLLLIGTGLTMVDKVLELVHSGFNGTLYAVSRHGLLPRAHSRTSVPAFAQTELNQELYGDLIPLFKAVKESIRSGSFEHLFDNASTVKMEVSDWRQVIDSLRPHSQALWASLSDKQKKRFLRHIRTYWDIHRHRMAPEIGDEIEKLTQSGKLKVLAGRLYSVNETSEALIATIMPRGGGQPQQLKVKRMVNCSGFSPDFRRSKSTLAQSLLTRELVHPHPSGLGISVRTDGAVLDANQKPSKVLFTLGTSTMGLRGETVAVPELRVQTRDLARTLLQSSQTMEFSMLQLNDVLNLEIPNDLPQARLLKQ